MSYSSSMPLLLLKELPRYECLLEGSKHFPDLDPSACEAFLHLLRAGDEAFRVAERNLHRFGVSQGRFGVLMLLWKSSRGTCEGELNGNASDPRTPAQLAEAAGVTRATMTGLIDTLERDGLVRREPDPRDRRMMSVLLTPEGQELVNRILPSHFAIMGRVMAALAESERRSLVGLLARIHRAGAEEKGIPEESPLDPSAASVS